MPLQKANLGVPTKRCPGNMEQIHRTPTSKYKPSKAVWQLYWNHTLTRKPLCKRTSSKKTYGGLPLKGESYLWIYIYIYNTNITKYSTINLNARYRLNFKHSRDDNTFLVKRMFHFYSIYICIEITLLRIVANDLLRCDKIQKWCLLKLNGRKAFVNGSHCS